MIHNIFLGLSLFGVAAATSSSQLRRMTPDETVPSICTTIDTEGKCEDFWWHELDATVQECQKIFGGSPVAWNTGAADTNAYDYWMMLGLRQEECAKFFGYDESSWDKEVHTRKLKEVEGAGADDTRMLKEVAADDICSDFVGQGACENYWWHEMSDDIKFCLNELFFTEAIWNYSGHNDPTLFKYWDDLTDKKMSCAELFGYNKQTWNKFD